jgi:DNA-binding transcriptional LysR family regulator
MGELRRAAPSFDIRLRPTTRETALQDLRRQEIDFAIGPLAAAPNAVTLFPLFTERFVMIARTGHPGVRKNITLKAFASLSHLLVSQSGEAFGSVDQALREIGLSRRIAITVPHFLGAPFIVGATDLVAVMAERVARRLAETADISVHRLPIEVPPWTVGLARLKGAPPDPAVEWLIGLIGTVAAET